MPSNGHKDNAIDLWWYVDDYESDDSQLTFTFCNAPDPNAGVTIDSQRFIDINPVTGWTGSTDVCVQAKDPGELSSTDTFKVSVVPSIYLPLILRNAR